MLLLILLGCTVSAAAHARGFATPAPALRQSNSADDETAAARYHTTPRRLAQARRYLRTRIFWGTADDLWLIAVLAWFAWGGRSAAARAWAERRAGGRRWLTTALFAALFTLVVFVASFPLTVYLGFFNERAFGFQHLTFAAWLGDWSKSLLVSLALTVPAVLIIYAVIRRSGRKWWLWAWGVCVVFVIFSIAIEPVFIEPLFNRFTPIQNQQLRERILAMARKSGIPAKEVYEVNRSRQSAHTNAYVVGLLGSERIVIYDTLLAAETPAEIEFVMGHEMGHYVFHHLWKGVAFTAALLLALFYAGQFAFNWLLRHWPERLPIAGAMDVAGLPLLASILALLLFLSTPLDNWFSRRLEHQADAYGLAISPDPRAAITGFQKDVNTDLIDPDPPRWIELWFFTHPSDRHRIEFAEQYCREHGVALPEGRDPPH